MTKKQFYNYKDMEYDLETSIDSLIQDKWKPDVVVGVLRGGIIPAVHISHYFNIPLVPLEWSTRDAVVGKEIPSELNGYLFSDSNILIVDDICDSGLTLKEIYDELKESYFNEKLTNTDLKNVKSLVLHYNEGQDVFTPDYYINVLNKAKKNVWLVYPWEKTDD